MRPNAWSAVILDAQALSLWLDDDRTLLARIKVFRDRRIPLVVCANTVIELASHPSYKRLDWVLSCTRVEPVTLDVARTAASLLRAARLTGHSSAIDASVAAIALEQQGRSAVMTSDPYDMNALCQGKADILSV